MSDEGAMTAIATTVAHPAPEPRSVRGRRRTLAILAVAVLAVLAALLIRDEADRRARADAVLDVMARDAGMVLDAWWDNHLTLQRAAGFGLDSDDAEQFGSAWDFSHVQFALLLDGDGRVQAAHPDRPDLVVGDDLSGTFPHIDAVLAGARSAFWATDDAVTDSGIVVASAVSTGLSGGVVTAAFDPQATALPRLLSATLSELPSARLALVEPVTGVTVIAPRGGLDGVETSTVEAVDGGWQVTVAAPREDLSRLVGGTTNPVARGVITFLVLLFALVVWRGPRYLAGADRRASDEGDTTALLETQEALERSREELRLFSYRVAHDLLGPLSGIRGLAEMLAEGRVRDEDVPVVTARMAGSADAAVGMVRALLGNAERLGGERRTDVELSVLHDWLQRMVATQLAETSGSVDLDTELHTLSLPEQTVRTVLLNLVGNALKYRRPHVPPRVTVAVRVLEDATVAGPEATAEFTVRDNGVGVAPDALPRMFERGERLHADARTDGHGSGLAECRRLLTVLGGRIEATTNDDHGLTVTFTVPVAATTSEATVAGFTRKKH